MGYSGVEAPELTTCVPWEHHSIEKSTIDINKEFELTNQAIYILTKTNLHACSNINSYPPM